MVRMHQVQILTDIFMDANSTRTGELHRAMEMIAGHGRGVIVALRDTMSGAPLSERVAATSRGEEITSRLMDYGVGAQILVDLGVRKMILLTNTSKVIIALEGYGLEVVEQRRIASS
jgi:3,4-dihydroxy 2-butanone 4-phosphate synthase/GTP cyclohydrolase II